MPQSNATVWAVPDGASGEPPAEEPPLNSLNSLMAQSKGKFTIFLGVDNQWYFRLRAPNGQTLCHSEGYSTRQSAQHGVNAVKGYAANADVEG